MGKLINDNAYHVHMSAHGDGINSFENTIKERQSNNKIMDRGKKKKQKCDPKTPKKRLWKLSTPIPI